MTVRHDGAKRRSGCRSNRRSLAVQEMRAGPSDSDCRIRVQTTGCCFVPMIEVVSETEKAGQTRQVSAGKVNVSEPLRTCRKRMDVIENRLQLLACDQLGGHLRTARAVTGIKAARAQHRLLYGTWEPFSRCQGRTSSGGPVRCRVPIREEGADGLVTAMKPGNAGGAKGPDSLANGRSQPAMGGADVCGKAL